MEIERALFAALRRGKNESEPYQLPESALPGLARTLERALASPDPLAEVKRALELATGLRNLGAVAAANHIEALLRNAPAAVALISEHLLAPAEAPRQGSAEPLRAPMIDAPKPAGPRVSDFLNPGRTDRLRR